MHVTTCREFKKLRPDIVMMGACEAPFAQACTFLGVERAMMLLHEDPQFLLERLHFRCSGIRSV